jgi:SAM-dependent methyltransferase
MDHQDAQRAAFYDLVNPGAEDSEFCLSLATLPSCGVLDLGCGTGALCCALAERGHRVTGVDRAAAMLAVARRKPYARRVERFESSAQTYSSPQHFDLIVMAGHTFQALLTDADALAVLETMRRHFKQPGRVAFESLSPHLDWVGEWTARSRMLSGGRIGETSHVTAADGEFISFQTSYHVFDRTLFITRTHRSPDRPIRTEGS